MWYLISICVALISGFGSKVKDCMAIMIVAKEAQPLGQERPGPWADHFLSSQPRLSQPLLHTSQYTALLTVHLHDTVHTAYYTADYIYHCSPACIDFCHLLSTFHCEVEQRELICWKWGLFDSTCFINWQSHQAKFFSLAGFPFHSKQPVTLCDASISEREEEHYKITTRSPHVNVTQRNKHCLFEWITKEVCSLTRAPSNSCQNIISCLSGDPETNIHQERNIGNRQKVIDNRQLAVGNSKQAIGKEHSLCIAATLSSSCSCWYVHCAGASPTRQQPLITIQYTLSIRI